MYGPFVPDMYSYDFVHYDKFGGSDPILEKPITTTGYSDLVYSPTGYELIQPKGHNGHKLQRGSTVYKERFDVNSNTNVVKILLLTISTSISVYFLMNLLRSYMADLGEQGNMLLFILFTLIAIGIAIVIKNNNNN
jgi:hypothetical protein